MDRHTLNHLLPSNQEDVDSARSIVALGYPTVAPVLDRMLDWLKALNSPVARVMAEFFVTLGAPALPVVEKALATRNDLLKYAIVTNVVQQWPREIVAPLGSTLQLLATGPTDYGTDLIALKLLAVHGLADPAWLGEWVAFKRKRHAALLDQVAEIEGILAGEGQGRS